MHRDFTSGQKSLKQPLELFMANVSLSQLNLKTAPQLAVCSHKTSVTKLAVGPSDDTHRRVGPTQPTSTVPAVESTEDNAATVRNNANYMGTCALLRQKSRNSTQKLSRARFVRIAQKHVSAGPYSCK